MEDERGEVVPSVTDKTKVTTTPEDLAMRGELRDLLESAIDLLPEMYRTVFLVRDVEGLSTEESAACLDVTQEAIKTRLHRARAMLRRSIEVQIGPSLAEMYPFMGGRCDRTVAAVLARLKIDPVLNAK